MLFNTLEFALFLPIMFGLYWFLFSRSSQTQNGLLLVGSYFFYGWWDWRFLILIFLSTSVDYIVGIKLDKTSKILRKKILLGTSIAVNLGILGFFKYANFFIENFIEAFTFLGSEFQLSTLKIILPVGISFYTFQSLSYSIDVYRGRITATKDVIAFFAYVSYFPQLVAGPIERASKLLPQISVSRRFNLAEAVDGLRQILWGAVKKVVIADNCAVFVNETFTNPGDQPGSKIILGAILFAFQIYGDFSGYSDMAIGISKLFGIRLSKNFAFPYFSRDIAEFWRRWHISLSSWFRDYVYIPLGGNRTSKPRQVWNILLVFAVSGFWHGANWTFIIWGIINALYIIPLVITGSNRKNLNNVAEGRLLPNFKELGQIILTFMATAIAWIIFRAESLDQVIVLLNQVFSSSLFSSPQYANLQEFQKTIVLIIIFLLFEWSGREHNYAIEMIGRSWTRVVRWTWYSALVVVITLFAHIEKIPFIYFQF